MGRWLTLTLAVLVVAGCRASEPPSQSGMHVARISYGNAPLQFGELLLPDGDGPFPVAVLIHGGCWLNAFDAAYIAPLAVELTTLGIATWTIEYRRLGDAGGGWPGTFLDVGAAIDQLRAFATDKHLDLTRVATVGHSAGGQLALWAAARGKLDASSAIRGRDPLPIHAVIALAAITDLATFRSGPADSCNSAVDQLLGGSDAQRPERYAQTSPLALLPLGVDQWLVHGGRDPIVPIEGVRAYEAAARKAGDRVILAEDPAAGHFEPTMVGGSSWEALKRAVMRSLATSQP